MRQKRKFNSILLVTILGVAVFASCGQESKDDDSDDSATTGKSTTAIGGNSSSTLSVKDETSVKAFDVVDDVTDAITDDGATNLSLVTDKNITRTKACTKNAGDGVVTVTVTLSGVGSGTIDRKKATVAMTSSASGTEVRQWTPPAGVTIDCQAADGPAKIRWKDAATVDDLKLGVTVDKTRANNRVITPKAGGDDRVATNETAVKGTRSIKYALVTSNDPAVVIRKKVVTSNVTRTSTVTRGGSKSTVMVEAVATAEAAPLVVDIVRQATDGTLVSKTIHSGTVIATDATTKSHIDSKFEKVVYDLSGTSANKCQPVSGTISGRAFDAAGTQTQMFVIAFGADVDSGISIAYDGGEAVEYMDYSQKDCGLANER